MIKHIKTGICYLLTLAMLLTLLPPQVYTASDTLDGASGLESYNNALHSLDSENKLSASTGGALSTSDSVSLEDARIESELVERRTEYSKEYKLDNGLKLAVVYSEPVHYQENGTWKEIDNTLKAHDIGELTSYKTAAGAWQVELPQELSEDAHVSVTRDGYTVSFVMAGELRLGTASAARAKASLGQMHAYDYSKLKEQAQHPEVIRDKLRSGMSYLDVYNNTDVIYDLDPHQLKESIVIHSYDPAVYGYAYSLNTEGLTAVLKADNSIELLSQDGGEVVMVMPAPFMIDNAGEVNTDVSVTLKETEEGYLLTYRLPRAWMADANRMWPVVLDPVVAPGTTTSNILDHFVAENYSVSKSHGYLYAGHHATYGDMRTYIKFSEIPDLTAVDIVKNAKLKLQYAGGTSGSTIIEAHQVNSAWTTGTITWSGQPSWNIKVQDYCVVGNSGEYSWDITDIAYGWYLGENNGVMLKGIYSIESGSEANWKSFYSVDYNKTNTSYWPYLEITYETETGVEDYWDYTTTSAGRAGSGYINNTTGNLTWIHSDLGFDGNLMPVSISHIYTLGERNETKYGLGKGWRTNFHQTVALSDSGAYYIWTDGDGTKHHFNSTTTTGTYKDEDGLRLTLTVSSNGYTITDIYGNTSNFDSYGRLTSMVNNQTIKSRITITYSGTTNRIATITDGANRLYKFSYNSSNLLTKISYHGKNKEDGTPGPEVTNVQFAYSSSKLVTITYADSKTTKPMDSHFTYDGTKLLTAMDIDDYKVKFGYSTGITKRAVSIEEFDGDKAGNKITIEFAHNKAKISDREHTVIHRYNDYGNLISVQDEQGNGQFYEYAAKQYVETPYHKNQLMEMSKKQNTVVNLLLDGSFESGSAWTDTSETVCSRTNTKAYEGKFSLQVASGSSYSVISAYGEAITIPAGETCTFSAYVNSVNAFVQLGLGTSTVTYAKSETQYAESAWKRLEVSYTNNNSSDVTIYPQVIIISGGNTYVDNAQVELASGASRYNLIQNGDFRTTGYWSGGNGTRTQTVSAAPQLDENVYKMTGIPTGTQSISQTINVSGNMGDVFVLSGWAKGSSVPQSDTSRKFGIKLTFNYSPVRPNEKIISFSSAYDAANDWQYAAGRVVAEGSYSSVTVELIYNCNMNDVYFDGIQLYRENFGEQYVYDTYGNLKSVTDVLGLTTTYEYSNYDPVKIVEASGITIENTYINHNLRFSKKSYIEDNMTVYLGTETYTYDFYGNLTVAGASRDDGYKETITSYSSDHNYPISITDELGNVTTYEYDQNTGMLMSVKYPKNTEATKTIYEYDEMFRLTQTTTTTDQGEEMSVEYSYDLDNDDDSDTDLLTQVTTGSSVYHFGYGDFSLRTNVSVGTTTLASYTYTDDTYHRLQSVRYGNGDKVTYTYDDLGRVTQELYEKTGTSGIYRRITYEYNGSGTLATMEDSNTGITTTYFYDTIGRNIGICESSGSGKHYLDYTYDKLGRVETFREICGDMYYYTDYSYNGNSLISQVKAGNSTEKYVYDTYERLTGWETYHGTSTDPLIEKSIQYDWDIDADENMYTLDRPKVWSYESNNFDVIYNYRYDANGNIISEQANQTMKQTTSQKSTTYVYDSVNQLTRENNQMAGKTWVWTYDNAGNILSKQEYAYTTGALGNPDETYLYIYGNSNWGDLLTNFNGEDISYDAIGNPLFDGTWDYTWREGRRLAQMKKSGETWTFTYDANGVRTKRTNGSSTYNYTYHGSQLTHMTYGSNVLHFYYDASGKPMSVNYNGVTYYYVLNLQGDVVALLDSTGDMAVIYRYDAWGRLLDVSGDLEFTLGLHNPLRYRGYVYDRETKLYYLQSRYYNPEIGRFINADSLVSTGQGVLGYNMFVYCNNNPMRYVDPSGYFVECYLDDCDVTDDFEKAMYGGASALGYLGAAVASVYVGRLVGEALATAVTSEKAEVYDYSQSMVDASLSKYDNKQPRVHHIVPVGAFSTRNLAVRKLLIEAQKKMRKAGIVISTDPNNLMIVSHGYHKSMHNNLYLQRVSIAILKSGETKEEIYETLFWLRVRIAALDSFSAGY